MSPMVDGGVDNLKPRRLAPVAVVMLLVLAATVAAAWAVVQVRSGATRRGTEIIHRMHEQGLAHFLGSQRQVNAYVATRPNGRTYGWKLVRIEPVKDDYAALIVSELQDGTRAQHTSERWRAAGDLDQVKYEATEAVTGQQTRGVSIVLAVQKSLRKVAVVMAQGQEGISGQGDAPDNYVPEGMLPLALRLAAEGGQPVNVMLILNNEALRPTPQRTYEPHFTPAQIRPVSQRQVEVRLGGNTETYTLNEQGQIVRISQEDGLVFSAVSVEELRKQFEVSQYLR